MKNDPRITWIGAILRKTSLDELPQLWCVLKGEMSLVGPRPPLPDEVARYTLAERRRLDIVPGMTGIWQVSGRADVPFERQVKLDVQYIQSQSFWLDFKILLKTIPAVIMGRGAY
jgi:lipopolysaccharide/colanic/teichoic acid biosynthesis glycosyltransferase